MFDIFSSYNKRTKSLTKGHRTKTWSKIAVLGGQKHKPNDRQQAKSKNLLCCIVKK